MTNLFKKIITKDNELDWLYTSDNINQKPHAHKNCKSKSQCSKVLETFESKEFVRQSVFRGTSIGICYTYSIGRSI